MLRLGSQVGPVQPTGKITYVGRGNYANYISDSSDDESEIESEYEYRAQEVHHPSRDNLEPEEKVLVNQNLNVFKPVLKTQSVAKTRRNVSSKEIENKGSTKDPKQKQSKGPKKRPDVSKVATPSGEPVNQPERTSSYALEAKQLLCRVLAIPMKMLERLLSTGLSTNKTGRNEMHFPDEGWVPEERSIIRWNELQDELIKNSQEDGSFARMNSAAAIIAHFMTESYTWEQRVDLMAALQATLVKNDTYKLLEKDVLLNQGSRFSDGFLSRGLQSALREAEQTVVQYKWGMSAWSDDLQRILKNAEILCDKWIDVDPITIMVNACATVNKTEKQTVLSWEIFVMMLLECHAYARERLERRAEYGQNREFLRSISVEVKRMEHFECECISLYKNTRLEVERPMVNILQACPAVLITEFGGTWKMGRKCVSKNNLKQVKCVELRMGNTELKAWVRTLSPKSRALFLCSFFGAAAGPEHYQKLGVDIGPALPTYDSEKYEHRIRMTNKNVTNRDRTGDNKYKVIGNMFQMVYGDETKYKGIMPRRKSPGGGPVTYTAQMVNTAVPGAGPVIELLHNRSPMSDESEVCGTATALCMLDIDIVQELLAYGLFDIPLKMWWKHAKGFFTAIRRTLTLGNVRGERLLFLRKFLNVTIREKGNSDIRMEHFKRGALVTRKHLWGHRAWMMNGQSTYTAYELKFLGNALTMISDTYESMYQDLLRKTIDEHWSERALRGAAGASKAIKKTKFHLPELAPADRPGKKVLVEYLDDYALERMIDSKPSNRAYYFVKPEPGRKLRSLYASYDEEAFVSSYANQSIENHMKREKGVMVRQTPADVIEWMSVSIGGLAGPEGEDAYWLSTDYSDYNSEHTFLEMCVLDLVCAHMAAAEEHKAYSPQKAIAHAWTCVGRRQSIIIYGKQKCYDGIVGMQYDEQVGNWFRVKNGLYSGSRTTARDNTWIHAIDLKIARTNLKALVGQEDFQWWALCGDDEDVAMKGPVEAGLYAATLAAVGHAINPVKQLAGHDNHEFLQLTAARTVRVEKPLNSLLATLATGNWYVQSGLWIQTAMNGVFSNYWELFCRGMPMQVCRRFAAYTMQHAMKIRVTRGMLTESEDVQMKTEPDEMDDRELVYCNLEWWKYRFSASVPPLFRMEEGDEVVEPPKYEAVAKPTSQWPCAASMAYVNTHKKLLRELPSRISDEFVQAVQSSTVGSCLRVWQQRSARIWCAKNWPKTNMPLDEIMTALNDKPDWEKAQTDIVDLDQYRWGIPKKSQMLTEEAICGKMGVPFFLARKLGGIRHLGKFVELEQWAKYSDTATHFYPLSGKGYRLQTNLRAASSWATAPIEGIHGQKTMLHPKTLAYVYAGNGAGKTTIAMKNNDILDLDRAWLDLYGCIRDRYVHGAHQSGFTRMVEVCSEILQHAVKHSKVLIGQLDPRLIQKAAKVAHVEVKVYSYDPGRNIRKNRLSMRGWSKQRVDRIMHRCDSAYDGAKIVKAIELNSMNEIVKVAANIKTIRGTQQKEQSTENKVPMRYVFDRTEAVTRKLEIDEGSRLITSVMAA
ncbi:polyprotein [Erysiphe necator associated totivirus 2]|nr:polyprotein [Erysiphe necator associated totivirus 2]